MRPTSAIRPQAGALRLLCLYDEGGALFAGVRVEGALTCGPKSKPCWKADKKGFAYKDPFAGADGIATIVEKPGDPGSGTIAIQGKNDAAKGMNQLRTGLTNHVQNSNGMLLEIHTDTGKCYDAVGDDVKKADADLFQASRSQAK